MTVYSDLKFVSATYSKETENDFLLDHFSYLITILIFLVIEVETH